MADAMGLPGGPAFPISIPGCGDNGCEGMSLRDYFAAAALAYTIGIPGSGPADIARRAYEVADAMLEERLPLTAGEG